MSPFDQVLPIRLALALFVAAWLSFPGRAHASSSPPPKDERVVPKDDGGLFGPVKIGALGSVGFPRPLSIEGLVALDDRVAVGLEYGALPQVNVSNVDVTASAIDADLVFFPLRNAFFIGVAAGRQTLTARSTLSLASLGSITEEVGAESWFVAPKLGVLWTSNFGLALGCDVGLQIPFAATFTNTLPAEAGLSQGATDVSHFFGKGVLPTVHLLRIGLVL